MAVAFVSIALLTVVLTAFATTAMAGPQSARHGSAVVFAPEATTRASEPDASASLDAEPALAPKDFLIAASALIGAALGFAGAITGARMAASAQDKRTRMEGDLARVAEETRRAAAKLEQLADLATELLGSAVETADPLNGSWDEKQGKRDALRVLAAQLLGRSRLLTENVDASVEAFTGAITKVANAPTSQHARVCANECGPAYEQLMVLLGEFLQRTGRIDKKGG